MNIADLQRRIGVTPDGKWGPASRAGLIEYFTNTDAPAVTPAELDAIAARLGCTRRQLDAVARVESAGSGFDRRGRPKILFERHIFHRLTGGRFTPAPFSMDRFGGYDVDSWDKLAYAAGKDASAAFASVSWGKFQVMGMHWEALGYPSPFDLAASTVVSEGAHYELLARFIERRGLLSELRALGPTAEQCRAFAREYNGPAFARNRYDEKLAEAMR